VELLIGSGNNHLKQIHGEGNDAWKNLITLDINPLVNPTVIHDLNVMPYPFEENTFDEIHAYEVMEHVGKLGDWKFFFDQWAEFSRICKSGALFFGTSPHFTSPWAWGDPSHTRVITIESFSFLNQKLYEQGIGNTSMTDFRSYYKANWELVNWSLTEERTLVYVLECKKGEIDYFDKKVH